MAPSGTVVWATYLGGSDYDHSYSVALDGSGGVIVVGETYSSDFTEATNSYTYASDAFAARVTASGSIAWTTYLGGSHHDGAEGVASDGSGGAVVVGFTASSDFAGATNSPHGGGDAFVARVTASGVVTRASYLGGSGLDSAWGVAPDGSGGAVVVGFTKSSDFVGAINPPNTHVSLLSDAFVVRVTQSNAVNWANYLGGSGDDYADGVTLDGSGGVIVVGSTYSPDFAEATNSYRGESDAFVMRLALNSGGAGVSGQVVNVYRTGAGGVRRDGLEGVTVRLYDGGTEVASTTSGADGSFSFATTGTGNFRVGASFTVTKPDGTTLLSDCRAPVTEGTSTELDLPLGLAEEHFSLTDRLSDLTIPAEFILVGDVDVPLNTGYDVSGANALVEGWLTAGADPALDPLEVEAMLRLVLAEEVLLDLSHDAASAYTAMGGALFDTAKWVVIGTTTKDAIIRAAQNSDLPDYMTRKITAGAMSVYRKFVFDRQWGGLNRIPEPYRDVALAAYDGMSRVIEGEATSTVQGTIEALAEDALEDAAVAVFAAVSVERKYVPRTQNALDLAVSRATAFDMSGEYVYALNSLHGVGGLYSAVHDYVVANSARSAAVRTEADMNGSVADLAILASANGFDVGVFNFGAISGLGYLLKVAQIAKLGIATYQGFEPLPDLYNLHPYAVVNSSFTAASGNRLAAASTAPTDTPTALRGATDTSARTRVLTATLSLSSAAQRGDSEARNDYADALTSLRSRLSSSESAEAEFSDLLDLDSALEAEIDVLEALARTTLTDGAMAVLIGTVDGLHAARLGLLGSTTATLIDPSSETFADAVAHADSVMLHLDLAYAMTPSARLSRPSRPPFRSSSSSACPTLPPQTQGPRLT